MLLILKTEYVEKKENLYHSLFVWIFYDFKFQWSFHCIQMNYLILLSVHTTKLIFILKALPFETSACI